jgi:hypothetical protein
VDHLGAGPGTTGPSPLNWAPSNRYCHDMEDPQVPPEPRRYATPTGEACARTVHVDGSVSGSGDCVGCGFCLLLLESAWGHH